MKTLEEFAIKEIQDLRTENKELTEQSGYMIKELIKKDKEIDKWKAKYETLVELLKEDFKPKLDTLANGKDYFSFSNCFSTNGTDDYYIEIFNLKKDEEEEQKR